MAGRFARLGPILFVAVAPGADAVAIPPVAGECHGLSKPHGGVGGGKWTVCDRYARGGKLTCANHRRLEAAAQRLVAAQGSAA